MKEPQTYEEFRTWLGECQHAGTKAADEWAEANPEAYTELRLEHMKTLPRDFFKKLKEEKKDEHIAAHVSLDLWFRDRVDEYGYHGDEHSARYWNEACKYFKVNRAFFYAAQVRVYQQKCNDVMRNPRSTKAAMKQAWDSFQRVKKEYAYARLYDTMKEKHRLKKATRNLFDYLLQNALERAPEDAMFPMDKMRAELTTQVTHILWECNGKKKPSRTAVKDYLEGHRTYDYEYMRPEVVEKLKEQFPDTPIEYLTTNPKKAK